MIEYLEKYSVIKDSPHGFKSGRSCLSNLLVFFDQISEVIDIGTVIDVMCESI